MPTIVNLRALNRSAKVRVKNIAGTTVNLNTATDVKADLDDAEVRRQLNRHSAIGQYVAVGIGGSPVTQLSGTNTANSGINGLTTSFAMGATTGIAVGDYVIGSDKIPNGTYVTSVVDGTNIRLSAATTGTVTASTALHFV